MRVNDLEPPRYLEEPPIKPGVTDDQPIHPSPNRLGEVRNLKPAPVATTSVVARKSRPDDASRSKPQERIRPGRLFLRDPRGVSGVSFVSWDRPFDQPVPLPGERPARTLRDAANYIRKLPQSQRETPEWRLAIQMLLDASENCGPILFARIGIERAVERSYGISPTTCPPMVCHGRRKLKRV